MNDLIQIGIGFGIIIGAGLLVIGISCLNDKINEWLLK